MECHICQETEGDLITTNCQHTFHLNCLKQMLNTKCPLCRTDLRSNLLELGMTETELELQARRQEHHQHVEVMVELNIDDFNLPEFIDACKRTVELDENGTLGYQDLIFDMNANASKYFHEISEIYKRKLEPGLFVYRYDSIAQFIEQQIHPEWTSIVEWAPASFFNGTAFENVVKDRMRRAKNTEYVVMIIISDDFRQSTICNAHIVDKFAYKSARGIRIAFQDIINSLKTGIRCRCSGHTPRAPNREFEWAIKVQKDIKSLNPEGLIQYLISIQRDVSDSEDDFDSDDIDSNSDSQLLIIPFYTRSAYQKVRQLMVDKDHYPKKYDSWLKIHNEHLNMLEERGINVLVADVKAFELQDFCLKKGIICDQRARCMFLEQLRKPRLTSS